MSEREIVVDWDRFRIYVKGWSFEHGNWPMVSPGHQRDCLSLLREVEKMEHEREIETREYEGARSLVKFHGDRAASYLQDRDSLKARVGALQDQIIARKEERDRAERVLRELHTTEEILRCELGTALAGRDHLKTELAELLSTIALQRTRMDEAVATWQEVHGKPDVWPDLGRLLEWLLTDRDRLRKENGRLKRELRICLPRRGSRYDKDDPDA